MRTSVKPAADGQEAQGVGMQRPLVGEVAVEDLEQGHHRARVHGLEHHHAARPQHAMGCRQHALQDGGRKMLGHLGREDAAQRAVRLRLEEDEEVAVHHVETARDVVLHDVQVAFDAAGRRCRRRAAARGTRRARSRGRRPGPARGTAARSRRGAPRISSRAPAVAGLEGDVGRVVGRRTAAAAVAGAGASAASDRRSARTSSPIGVDAARAAPAVLRAGARAPPAGGRRPPG